MPFASLSLSKRNILLRNFGLSIPLYALLSVKLPIYTDQYFFNVLKYTFRVCVIMALYFVTVGSLSPYFVLAI